MPGPGEKRSWRWVHETHTLETGCAAANKARWSPKEGKSSHSGHRRKGMLGYKKKRDTQWSWVLFTRKKNGDRRLEQ